MTPRRENGCGAGGALFCALSFLKEQLTRFLGLRGARASFFVTAFCPSVVQGWWIVVKMSAAPQRARVARAFKLRLERRPVPAPISDVELGQKRSGLWMRAATDPSGVIAVRGVVLDGSGALGEAAIEFG